MSAKVCIATTIMLAYIMRSATSTPSTSQAPFKMQGVNTGLGSWFRANDPADNTNGHSWCNYPYTDDSLIFAPCLSAMGGQTQGDVWKANIEKFCGLEANVTDPRTGNSMLLYIGDAFEDLYCKGSGWIDIMIGPFKQLHGDPNGDKNNDINDVQWELTGKKSDEYSAGKA